METNTKIVRTFHSVGEIYDWMSDAENMAALKKEYPPAMYHAELDLKDLVIKIMEKNRVF